MDFKIGDFLIHLFRMVIHDVPSRLKEYQSLGFRIQNDVESAQMEFHRFKGTSLLGVTFL